MPMLVFIILIIEKSSISTLQPKYNTSKNVTFVFGFIESNNKKHAAMQIFKHVIFNCQIDMAHEITDRNEIKKMINLLNITPPTSLQLNKIMPPNYFYRVAADN